MASGQAEAIRNMFREHRERNVDAPASLEDMRAGADGMGDLTAEPEGVTYTATDVDGLPALWADPVEAARDRVILLLHGGGYMSGSIRSHHKLAGHLARSTGCRALIVEYRLAPEHPFPAGLDDASATVSWLLAQGFNPAGIALCGDSAGGGLAVATLLTLREKYPQLPAACVLLSPWLDVEGTGESMTTRADLDMLVSPAGQAIGRRMYLAGHDPRDPLISPIYADLSGLPPLYIQVGDHECLLDDSTRLASNAQRDGVDVQLDVFPEMQHVFQLSAGNLPEADDAVQRIGEWLRPRLRLAAQS